jgi:hypothetical protein
LAASRVPSLPCQAVTAWIFVSARALAATSALWRWNLSASSVLPPPRHLAMSRGFPSSPPALWNSLPLRILPLHATAIAATALLTRDRRIRPSPKPLELPEPSSPTAHCQVGSYPTPASRQPRGSVAPVPCQRITAAEPIPSLRRAINKLPRASPSSPASPSHSQDPAPPLKRAPGALPSLVRRHGRRPLRPKLARAEPLPHFYHHQ